MRMPSACRWIAAAALIPAACAFPAQGSFNWQTATPEDLHAVVQTLPLFSFMTITGTPVMKHPVEEAYEREHGPIGAFVS